LLGAAFPARGPSQPQRQRDRDHHDGDRRRTGRREARGGERPSARAGEACWGARSDRRDPGDGRRRDGGGRRDGAEPDAWDARMRTWTCHESRRASCGGRFRPPRGSWVVRPSLRSGASARTMQRNYPKTISAR
jgi:hypothetical protein